MKKVTTNQVYFLNAFFFYINLVTLTCHCNLFMNDRIH
jgi:hypothetical protein